MINAASGWRRLRFECHFQSWRLQRIMRLFGGSSSLVLDVELGDEAAN
jgi:hypothetical protein